MRQGKNVDKKIPVMLTERVLSNPDIIAARIYGSSLYVENPIDIDVAVLVPSRHGCIDPNCHQRLKKFRITLQELCRMSIDLVPHTEDEFEDASSPLWSPRYNPSLVFGEDIKGSFAIKYLSEKYGGLSSAEMVMSILHDNRTITRRQILHGLEGMSGRIFASKLLHGPGNALTLHSCRSGKPPNYPPSDLKNCQNGFDEVYGCDSAPADGFLSSCRHDMNDEKGVLLMSWYEHLFRVCAAGDEESRKRYDQVCRSLR